MKLSRLFSVGAAAFALMLVLSIDSGLYAQGRGRGGGNAGGNSGGMGGGRPSTSPGIDRGIMTSGDRSNGRSDNGRSTASGRSGGRYDTAEDRARARAENRERAMRNMPDDNELNRYRGISKKLGVPAETLRARYLEAATLNPNLKFGQFVAANVVAGNLNRRYPNVTSAAILEGLQNGDSIGQTLRDLRVEPDLAKRAEKEAKRQIKDSMPQD